MAALRKLPGTLRDNRDATIVVNLSGRGDKDLATIVAAVEAAS